MSSNTPQNQPGQPGQTGLWSGHAEYIKGAAEAAVGTITGSQAWSASGAQDKAHARASLQAAAGQRDPATSGYGRAEEIAGRLTGCEGMRSEGAASKGAAAGGSGTGGGSGSASGSGTGSSVGTGAGKRRD
ncbi:uncharacterized protein C8A04DRAFT_25518 [Dichotomopilus funicola]|uniref:Uncharacterized protein n=1 Tax=Dichotomopilus funicola TaxID=1934379 RepID=A0AAN6ZPZ5_9PEZI|nr:hypothetical protein C8A04DRAFT_25518 [Dichotomopilus funicola]